MLTQNILDHIQFDLKAFGWFSFDVNLCFCLCTENTLNTKKWMEWDGDTCGALSLGDMGMMKAGTMGAGGGGGGSPAGGWLEEFLWEMEDSSQEKGS